MQQKITAITLILQILYSWHFNLHSSCTINTRKK